MIRAVKRSCLKEALVLWICCDEMILRTQSAYAQAMITTAADFVCHHPEHLPG